MLAGAVTLEQLTPEVYRRLAEVTEYLRHGLREAGQELEIPVQVTGLGSLFGIHFLEDELVGYRDIARADGAFRHQVFLGLLNEGILMAPNLVGAVSTAISETEVDTFMEAFRAVLRRLA
jgi:glutamate-1-semialdehyde 2,1-aminomutase